MIRVERAGDGRLGIVDDEDVILFLFFERGVGCEDRMDDEDDDDIRALRVKKKTNPLVDVCSWLQRPGGWPAKKRESPGLLSC